MSNGSRVIDGHSNRGVTVSFGARYQASEQFDLIFKEGMSLVERTAAYLDGQGRRDSKGLKGHTTVLYATESMRLTTRLLDLASWLLVRRALKEGEITESEARSKRQRIKLQSLGRPSHIKGFAELPSGLRDLIEASFHLHDRIVQLDRAMKCPEGMAGGALEASATLNPVGDQLALLTSAFAGRVR